MCSLSSRLGLRKSSKGGRFKFGYVLTGTGWASATIRGGRRKAEIPVSWLTRDALGDLLAAVTDALGPLGRGECSWELEPGEYAWSFRRRGAEIDVHIDYYDEWRHFELAPGDEWVLHQTPTPIFDATAPAVNVATAVVDATERLLARDGDDGYRKKWDAAPFPHERLARLQVALTTLPEPD